MNNQTLENSLRTGQILLTRNTRGPLGKFIRVATGESFAHAAIVERKGNQAFVHEMSAGKGGHRKVPFAEWLNEYGRYGVTLGTPKGLENADQGKISDILNDFQGESYGWLGLLRVWLSQVFHGRFGMRPKWIVCSTFAQVMLERGLGVETKGLLDPGDLAKFCVNRMDIR